MVTWAGYLLLSWLCASACTLKRDEDCSTPRVHVARSQCVLGQSAQAIGLSQQTWKDLHQQHQTVDIQCPTRMVHASEETMSVCWAHHFVQTRCYTRFVVVVLFLDWPSASPLYEWLWTLARAIARKRNVKAPQVKFPVGFLCSPKLMGQVEGPAVHELYFYFVRWKNFRHCSGA